MYTVLETRDFQVMAAQLWDIDTHYAFVDFIACNPFAGDVIPGASGARKVRWQATGRGKRSGTRVVYFNQLEEGEIVLLAVYAKNEMTDLPRKAVRRLKNEAE